MTVVDTTPAGGNDVTTRSRIERRFTVEGTHPYDMVEWHRIDARISNWKDGSVAFEQTGVEFPVTWSQNAVNIVAQKYFRGAIGTDERETSLRHAIDRIVDTYTRWGVEEGYFLDDTEARVFSDELKYLMVTQRASFNSPVWFNVGVPDTPQQVSACFILSVDDEMTSILNWYAEEGLIFKGGSGAGVNLSRLRGSSESMTGGGNASGPVSFMRGADASAGTISSGGKTRRAAKMVILDVDHPDIEQFIWCKANEEDKIRALAAAGFDMGVNGADIVSVQYQNANNSVRVTDEFMAAVIDDADWDLIGRRDGEVVKTVRARDLMRQISTAAWRCADPGVQFDTTINRWHTAANTGRINASNPCSEYLHLDNSSCNLASINLLHYLDGFTFDVEAFRHSVQLVFTAQEISISRADFPTAAIAENTRRFRQLGLGYANLGATLMALGLPYDSDAGRAVAAAITAVMHNTAYETSGELAGRVGPFDGYAGNVEHMTRVLGMHRSAVDDIDVTSVPADLAPMVAAIIDAARRAGDGALAHNAAHGVRNAQATVLAPTGTTGLAMDCDTTGVEPDLSLVKHKTLVGGGTMTIVNQTIPRALRRLGYDEVTVEGIIAHIDGHKTIVGAPGFDPSHLPVFACSMGDNVIHYMGHVKMMGALQPFLSGAISKTCNVPEDATIDDIEDLYLEAWRLGVKAVAVYRDNCKVGQPLASAKKTDEADVPAPVVETVAVTVEEHPRPDRERLPARRLARTTSFRVADCEGYMTIGEYEDGRPGEMFLKVSKQGSTLSGILDAFAINTSLALQYGVPIEVMVAKLIGMKFEPAGMTSDPEARMADSIIDYVAKRLALDYVAPEVRHSMGIFSIAERTEMVNAEHTTPATTPDAPASQSVAVSPKPVTWYKPEAPLCMTCGVTMQRNGACHLCPSCGSSSGCS